MNESDATSGGDTGPSQPSVSVALLYVTAVSLKMPPFLHNNPQVCLTQSEAQFHKHGIKSQETIFSDVISL